VDATCPVYPGADITPTGSSGPKSATSGSDKLHSIISSASASKFAGTAMPSIFAVLRLITRINLLACSMGRSPGLAPLGHKRRFDLGPATSGTARSTDISRLARQVRVVPVRTFVWMEIILCCARRINNGNCRQFARAC
jgi:hypothetical protein